MRDLRGKRALVTGAASGIGRALALELARRGVRLFLLDLDREKLDAVIDEARRLGVEALGSRCDVSVPREIDDAVAMVLTAWGGVDLLVNNAGVAFYGPTHEMTGAQWDRVMSVNLLAPIHFTRLLLPELRKNAESHILNVCSITGLVAKRRTCAYQTSKFGMVGLSLSLRAEYSPYGIGVTALCPGFTHTNLFVNAERQGMLRRRPKLRRWWMVSADYVAKKGVAAVIHNRGLVVVPLLAWAAWCLQRISPAIFDWHSHFVHRRGRNLQNGHAAPATDGAPAMATVAGRRADQRQEVVSHDVTIGA